MAGLSNNCGTIIPDSCSPFTGVLTILKQGDSLPCNASVKDAISKIDSYLKTLIDGNDFTSLTPGSFGFDPDTVTASELHQLELNKIEEHTGQITALQTQLNTLNIANEVINIVLPSCLTSDAAGCSVATNSYKLITLLTVIVNKLCNHESRILNLE